MHRLKTAFFFLVKNPGLEGRAMVVRKADSNIYPQKYWINFRLDFPGPAIKL